MIKIKKYYENEKINGEKQELATGLKKLILN